MTFANCAKTEADSSIVSGWFETKCTKLESFNGSPYTIEAFLADTVAGISPPVQAGYEMYEVLSAIGTQLGTGTPDRTFVIYSQGPPLYEFFCYRQDPPDQSKCSGKC